MKPAGDISQRARLLVIGHVLSVVCFWFALHLTASSIRIYFVGLLGIDWFESSPGAARLMLSADTFLKSFWTWMLPAFALALWVDWKISLRALNGSNPLFARLWAYCVFGPMLLLTSMCVGLFRFWAWQLEQTIGGLG